MTDNRPISEEYLLQILDYDPDTGFFRWKKQIGRRATVGAIAGSKDTHGYWHVTIKRKPYLAHRLAWFFYYGKMPEGDIDHINGNRLDNRISNLRIATREQNAANSKRRVDNTSGARGVAWHKSTQKWAASIRVNKQRIWLGVFCNKTDAEKAYFDAAKIHHGDYRREK